MRKLPYATEKTSSFETFEAVCPTCGHRNRFNRHSDLGTFAPIAFREVVCQSPDCEMAFGINCDIANPGHEVLCLDAARQFHERQYGSAVVKATQSLEYLFALYFRVELVFKPFGKDPDDLDLLNKLVRLLADTTNNHTFAPMRAHFIGHILDNEEVPSLAAAERTIGKLAARRNLPAVQDLRSADLDPELRALLLRLHASSIDRLRNRIVHKEAYRPSQDEAFAAVEETERLVFGLSRMLDLYDEPMWYVR